MANSGKGIIIDTGGDVVEKVLFRLGLRRIALSSFG